MNMLRRGALVIGVLAGIALVVSSAVPAFAGGRVFFGVGLGFPFFPYPYPYPPYAARRADRAPGVCPAGTPAAVSAPVLVLLPHLAGLLPVREGLPGRLAPGCAASESAPPGAALTRVGPVPEGFPSAAAGCRLRSPGRTRRNARKTGGLSPRPVSV